MPKWPCPNLRGCYLWLCETKAFGLPVLRLGFLVPFLQTKRQERAQPRHIRFSVASRSTT
jgi:hypothetical protein